MENQYMTWGGLVFIVSTIATAIKFVSTYAKKSDLKELSKKIESDLKSMESQHDKDMTAVYRQFGEMETKIERGVAENNAKYNKLLDKIDLVITEYKTTAAKADQMNAFLRQAIEQLTEADKILNQHCTDIALLKYQSGVIEK